MMSHADANPGAFTGICDMSNIFGRLTFILYGTSIM